MSKMKIKDNKDGQENKGRSIQIDITKKTVLTQKQTAELFDLLDLSDAPDNVRVNIRAIKNRNPIGEYILELFDIKPSLNLNEIVIGLYRRFNLEKSREHVRYRVGELCRSGYLDKIASSSWELK